MEDSVKALIISAGLLIGLMIVSFGIILFSSLNKYSDNAQNRIDENTLQQFNQKFTKYINCDDERDSVPSFELTIHDVITVANTAYESNENYELTAPSNNNYYVSVYISDTDIVKEIKNGNIEELLKNNSTKKYKCTYRNVKINENTGRVYEIKFQEYL